MLQRSCFCGRKPEQAADWRLCPQYLSHLKPLQTHTEAAVCPYRGWSSAGGFIHDSDWFYVSLPADFYHVNPEFSSLVETESDGCSVSAVHRAANIHLKPDETTLCTEKSSDVVSRHRHTVKPSGRFRDQISSSAQVLHDCCINALNYFSLYQTFVLHRASLIHSSSTGFGPAPPLSTLAASDWICSVSKLLLCSSAGSGVVFSYCGWKHNVSCDAASQ